MIGAVKKLAFKTACMCKHELARDAERKGYILASQRVYDAFERKKITGVWLVIPDDFYDAVQGRG